MLALSGFAILILLTLAFGSRWLRSKESESLPRPELASVVKEDDVPWFDLVKLEYEKAADRYENIYKAIWQNFSYSAVIGAAILTFGASQLRLDLVGALGLSPLLFWLVATYFPMNHYGEQTRRRLRGIERDINDLFFISKKPGGGVSRDGVRFQHFTNFGSARPPWRVVYVMSFTGLLAGAFWLWLLAGVISDKDKRPLQLKHDDASQLVQQKIASDSIKQMTSRADSLALQVREQRHVIDSLQRVHH
ncbi:MAG TPA: hypothetical protein VFA43_00455 [Gemmatimonadaceae bacterium]|nr:hypothetical protein [Gemmatimonadaceae bacterium]